MARRQRLDRQLERHHAPRRSVPQPRRAAAVGARSLRARPAHADGAPARRRRRRRGAADRDRAGRQRLPEKRSRQQALKNYNHDVSRIAQESDEQVSRAAVLGARRRRRASRRSTSRSRSTSCASRRRAWPTSAKGLSVPGAMAGAQRDLLLVLDFRAEGLTKVASLVPTALGGQAKQASTLIAGDMEIFLASDVDLLPARRAADPADARRQRHPRPEHRADAASCPTSAGSNRRPSTRASPASAASSGQSGQSRRAPTAARCKGVSVGTNALAARTDAQPHQRRRQPDVHRDGRKRRRIPRDERQGQRHGDRRRQAVKASHAIEHDRTGQERQRRNPRHRRPARRGLEDRSRTSSRCPARRTSKTTRAPTWRSSNSAIGPATPSARASG